MTRNERAALERAYAKVHPDARTDAPMSDRALALAVIAGSGIDASAHITRGGERLSERSDDFVVGFAIGCTDENVESDRTQLAREAMIERNRNGWRV